MDIIDRLNDGEIYVNTIDDAIHEIEDLRLALKMCMLFIESNTRAHAEEVARINNYNKRKTEKLVRTWIDESNILAAARNALKGRR